MNNYHLVGAAVIIAIAIGTAPIHLEKYKLKVCIEQYEILLPKATTLGRTYRAGITLKCMGVQ